jgi:hypothetical protein
MVAPTCFGIASASSRSVPSAYWSGAIATHHATGHNSPIHNILATTPHVSISQKAPGMLPEDGNVMPKHVGAIIQN